MIGDCRDLDKVKLKNLKTEDMIEIDHLWHLKFKVETKYLVHRTEVLLDGGCLSSMSRSW